VSLEVGDRRSAEGEHRLDRAAIEGRRRQVAHEGC
jgi:hypothetical protein